MASQQDEKEQRYNRQGRKARHLKSKSKQGLSLQSCTLGKRIFPSAGESVIREKNIRVKKVKRKKPKAAQKPKRKRRKRTKKQKQKQKIVRSVEKSKDKREEALLFHRKLANLKENTKLLIYQSSVEGLQSVRLSNLEESKISKKKMSSSSSYNLTFDFDLMNPDLKVEKSQIKSLEKEIKGNEALLNAISILSEGKLSKNKKEEKKEEIKGKKKLKQKKKKKIEIEKEKVKVVEPKEDLETLDQSSTVIIDVK